MADTVAPRTELNIADTVKLASGLFQDGHFEQSEDLFRAAVQAGGGYEAINGWGMALNELERPAEAMPVFDQAYTCLRMEMMALMANRAKALAALGRAEEALAIYNDLMKASPNVPFLQYSRGLVLLQIGMHDDAIADFDAVLAVEPNNDLARFARGFAELVLGDYEAGFRDYEARLKDDIDEPNVPLWDGKASLKGKTILIHGEMGLGDNIMFMRYIPALIKMAKRVIVVVPVSQIHLIPAGAEHRLADKTTWPKLDYWARFMSLAYLFGTIDITIPHPVPLRINDALTAKWHNKLSGDTLKVGLCWSGNPKSRYDAWRSIPLEQLQTLFDLPGVTFYSLQIGVRPSDRLDFQDLVKAGKLIDLAPEMTDFEQSAHIIRELDYVVTCDTALAHLAGTVGTPTSVMLTAFRTYWLWITKLKHSPWYPSIRVIRQQTDGAWEPVVAEVKHSLRDKSLEKAA